MVLAVDRNSTGEHSWLLTDHQGTVNRVVDANGQVEGDLRFDSFGVITSTDTPATLDVVVGYTGQVYDIETGLHYFNARYYDSQSGRFLSEDPIGLAAGDKNLYRYVFNNPVNLVDPTGLAAKALGGLPGFGMASAVLGGMADYGEAFGAAMSSAYKNLDSGAYSTPASFPIGTTRSAPSPIITAVPSADDLAQARYDAVHAQNMKIDASSAMQRDSRSVGFWTGVFNVVHAGTQFLESTAAGIGDLAVALFEDAPNQFMVQHVTGKGIELQSNAVQALDEQSYWQGVGTVSSHYAKNVSRYSHAEAAVQYALNPTLANGARLQQESIATGAMLLPAARLSRRAVSAPRTAVGHSRVYRAVSEAEYQDILRTGRFRQGPNSLEGKWFADSLEGARAHGDALQGPGRYRIIEADVPDNAPSLFRQPNLDGRGPARFLDLDDLGGVTPRPAGGG